jgi:uncharacterized membrane protein YccC
VSRPPSAALQKGVRVAVAATAGFAVGRYVVDDPQTAVFASLTPIALLGLGDVGGSLAARQRSYLVALAVAALLTVLGTAVSEDTAAAALALGAVAFIVSLSAVGGSNVAGLGRALILVMVVSAGIPAPDSVIGERLLGVAIGGLASLAGVLVLWPGRADADFRRRLAAVFSALAEYARSVAEDRPERERVSAAASEALDAARPYALAVVERPSGPAAVEAAQRLLTPGLRQLEEMLARVSERWLASPGRELVREAAEGFARAASLLETGRGRPPDLDALEAARRRFGEESEARLSELLGRGTDREALAHAFGQGFRLRRFGALSAAVCGQARVAAGIDAALWVPGVGARPRTQVDRIVRLLRVHLTSDSVVVRNAARLAVALAAARALAGAFDLQHGFWVVFATLSVLRGTARGTRGSAARALLGTAIGAVIATALLLALESEAGVQVALVPLFVLVAIAGGAVSFVVGQAGFTLLIVTLFNLVAPPQWDTGLIRLEDVALGVLVGLAIGAAAWPSGPGGQLRRALGEAIRDGSRYAADVSRALLGGQGAQARLIGRRDDAAGSARRAEDVFMAYLAEAVDPQADLERWSGLLERMYRLWYGAGLMYELERPQHYPCPDLSQALTRAVDELEQGYEASAEALIRQSGPPPPPTTLPPLGDLGGQSLVCARSLAGSSDPGALVAGVRLFGVRAWIVELGRQLTELRSAAQAAD